ncbi:MAG: aminotransferase class IV [Rhabdochlamydiaceae bacterium]
MFYINGVFLEEEPKISSMDLGLIRGYGVFDFMRTYQGHPFHLEDHLLRLQYSAKIIDLNLPESIDDIHKIVEILMTKHTSQEANIKIILTGGVSPDHLMPAQNHTFIIQTYPLKPFPADFHQKGIKVISTPFSRTFPKSKTLNYIGAILALKKAQEAKAQEAIYVDDHKQILEATTSNIFAIKKGVLITPLSENILIGITREVVLRICQNHFPIEIRSLTLKELLECDEIFISSSNKEIMPVIQVDDSIIGTGVVGPYTKKIKKLFFNYTQSPPWAALNIERYKSI